MKTAKEIKSLKDNVKLEEVQLAENLAEKFFKAYEKEIESSLLEKGYYILLNKTLEEFTDWKIYNMPYTKIKSLVAKKLSELGFYVEKQTFGWSDLVIALSEKIGKEHLDNHARRPMTEEEWDFARAS